MSTEEEEYKGPIPIPSKGQSKEDFEKEELSKDQYTEFSTVDEILAKPERYATIINNENFQMMLSPKESNKKDEGKEEKKEDSSKSTDSATIAPKPDDLDVEMEVDTSDPVEEIVNVEERVEPVVKPQTDSKVTQHVNDMIGEVTVDEKGGLLFIKKDGLTDLCDKRAFMTFDPLQKKRFRMYYELTQKFVPVGRVDGGPKLNSEGFLENQYNFTFSTLEHSDPSSINRDLKEREPLTVSFPRLNENGVLDANRRNAAIALLASNASNNLRTNVPERSLIDLSIERRDNGSSTAGVCMINPSRLVYLLEGLRAHKYMMISYDELVVDNDVLRLINPRLLRLVRRPEISEADDYTANKMSVFRYERFTIPGMIEFFYTAALNEPYHISKPLYDRSFKMAKDMHMHFVSGMAGSITSIVKGQISNKVTELQAVQPGKAVEFMSELCSFLSGGRNRSLQVDLSGLQAYSQTMICLHSFACLCLLDVDFVEPETITQLLYNVLIPFYSEHDETRLNAQNRPFNVEGIQTIGDRFLLNRALLPAPNRIITAQGRRQGNAIRNTIAQALTRDLNAALNIFYTPLNKTRDLIASPLADPYTPFIAQDDVISIIVYGNRTDPAALPEHNIDHYKQQGNTFRNLIRNMCATLSLISAHQYTDEAFDLLVPHAGKMSQGMAIVTTSMVEAAQHIDLLPSTGRNNSPCDRVSLPIDGALSFIMCGLNSSDLVVDHGYIEFRDRRTPKLPSRYPMQYTMERAIFHILYNTFKNVMREDLTVTKPDELIALHKHIMSLYFSSADPDSERRLRALLDLDMTFGAGVRVVGIPAELSSNKYVPSVVTSPVPPRERDGLVRGFSTADANYDDPDNNQFQTATYLSGPEAQVNVFPTAFNSSNRVVTEVYVMFDPITPRQFSAYDGGVVMVWNNKVDVNTLIDFEDILRAEPYHKPGPINREKLISMAKLYARRRGLQGREGVKIKNVYTTFEMEEVTPIEDVSMEKLEFVVEENSKFLDYSKYQVKVLSVPFFRLTDIHDKHGGNFATTRVQNVMSYVTFPTVEFDRTLVHINNANAMYNGLYKRDDDGVEIDRRHITNQRLIGWNGITYSSRLTLSKREIEEVKIRNELIRREVIR